jgi:N-acyl-D-amino-acid deacylase
VSAFDLIVRNAKIVDGTGSPWRWGDVGITDRKIEAIGKIPEGTPCGMEVNAGGEVLAPGFIDIHTHNDFLLLKDATSSPKLKQGITTIMIGQCGISAAPVTSERVHLLDAYTGFIKAGAKPLWNWTSFGDYLNVLESLELGLNVGSFVGHGTIRLNVMGFDSRDPSQEEVFLMRELAQRAMEEGAFGMTSGLIYPPGVFSSPVEVQEVAKGLRERNGLYLSHMRNESYDVVKSVYETIEVAEKAGIPGQVLHHKACGQKNFGKVQETLMVLERARERGVDMTVDQYPYAASSTTLRAILPPWVHEGGVEKIMERLSDSLTRERLKKEMLTTENWENMLLSSGGPEGVMMLYTPETPEYEGCTLKEIGDFMGRDPIDAAFEVILANKGSDTACYFLMDERDVQYVMKHPLVMVASDSIPSAPGAKCHPRTNGAFPRVLGKYVREKRTLNLEEAVRKMSGFPATRLNLSKKGFIKHGMDADLVLFNPDTVRDGATFDNPLGDPEGISYVFVGGRLAVKNGICTGVTAGKVLRN